MTNKQIARVLKETGALVELTGGNPFRARAFTGAARKVERLEVPALDLVDAGRLTEIDGIGKGLAAQIEEIGQRGSFEARDDLLNAIPHGLLDVLRIKGLGAKKVRALWQGLGVIDIDALEEAVLSGRVATLDGFGAKTADNIIKNIGLLRAYSQQRRLPDALHQARQFQELLRERFSEANEQAEVHLTGQLRRRMPTIDSAELLMVTSAHTLAKAILEDKGFDSAATAHPGCDAAWTGSLPDGLVCTVHLCAPDSAGTALLVTTGSAHHVDALQDAVGDLPIASTEDELYQRANWSVVPPVLRDLPRATNWAEQQVVPHLIQVADLQGSLHNHSTYSDGADALAAMADAVRTRGWSYLGICDHSRSLTIAHGLSIERVQEQHAEIDTLNAQYEADQGAPFRIFKGIESDILADGSLDYPDDVLASFDLIVASIHSRFNMTKSEATKRLIKAIENPYTTILGHPTGRLLLAREGYPIDHEAVLDACARCGVAVELNANPYRLDLDWRWVATAVDKGVLVSINPDAHAIDQLDLVEWGVAAAQKGGLTAEHCLNARELSSFAAWLETRRVSIAP